MKTTMMCIDCQQDFLSPKGSLYIKNAEKILPKLKQLTTFARERNLKVVNTADYHINDSMEISNKPDFLRTFPPHCMAGHPGGDFVNEVCPRTEKTYYVSNWLDDTISESCIQRTRNIIIFKDKFNVFEGNKHTEKIFEIISPDIIVVYGVASDICVHFAVKELIK